MLREVGGGDGDNYEIMLSGCTDYFVNRNMGIA
jgi:hypothetical protein